MSWISKGQYDRDHLGLRNVCAADGHEGTKGNPLALSDTGMRVHKSHFTTPGNGFYGHEQKGDPRR